MRTFHQTQPTVNRPRTTVERNRSGFSLIELIVSGALLGTAIALTVPTLRWVGFEQRAAEQRQLAIVEATNLMDRLTSESWEALTADHATAVTLSEPAIQQLPQAELKVTIDTKPDTPDEKRISIQLAWKDQSGTSTSPVRVTAWVYRRGAGK